MNTIENLKLLTGVDASLNFVSKQLSAAEVLTMFTNSPITLLPAKTGYVYIPRLAFFQKPAGTAYTVAGMTAISINAGATALAGGANLQLGLLDQTVATSIVMWGPGSASALFSGTNLGTVGSTALTLVTAGANPAVGNSPLNLLVLYNEFPLSFAVI